MMRDLIFYKKIFGEAFHLTNKQQEDFVQIIDVDHIRKYESQIFKFGGNLTVPIMELPDSKKVAYYSDPDGNIFALLENGNS